MRIKIIGCTLTLIFGIITAWVIAMAAGLYLDPSVVIDPTAWATRFLSSPDNVYAMIQALSEILWHYRGIDMVLLGVFLFAAALASSAFFYEVTKESSDKEEKE